ncbi:flavodoxin domain-containing protein [Carnobacterium sp. ISL-102]|uniref:flavodoxin domain-containing protein n=1 Tax=Carnobacterium sp. ISL-102 TaxID=2819142 RepID=UPI001BE5335D|nr:flavodoxin domain-containing protein [Carnobacterium sp. ISL-102]MBT2732218.1 flavodoxin domain-containing protein [Carnobacterium sp. ISL-102]
MKTLIAYASKHGCTEKCAKLLEEHLDGETERVNLKEQTEVDFSKYDKVVLGSPVYVGKILKEVDTFAKTHLNELEQKTIGLFICGMQEEHTLRNELEVNYPTELQDKALVRDCFGGAFDFSDMNFAEKMITKKVTKIDKDVSAIREDAIQSFAETLNQQH